MAQVQDLLKWATTYKATLHRDVEIYQDPVTGLSFRAVRAVPSGTRIVTCPYLLSLSYLNAIEASHRFPRQFSSNPFPPEFLDGFKDNDPHIIGHFFLMQQFLMGEKSFWWHYIRLLPQADQPQSLGIPIWWSDADRKFLNGTNAEPPLKKRKEMWHAEWTRGIELLKDCYTNWVDYSYVLYQWAATIFGSRSFRASLTISSAMLGDPEISGEEWGLNFEHVRRDRFSILLPLVDIGNHNGFNQVCWRPDPIANEFILVGLSDITQGSQIFNYYGNKSNSELLLGYGFTLPPSSDLDRDLVNLKLKPGPEALQLRRTQDCHVTPSQPEEEFMFTIQMNPVEREKDERLEDFRVFSDGLVDMVTSMVATKREKRFVAKNSQYCPESDPSPFDGPLSINTIRVLFILHGKLDYEAHRIRDAGADLGEPQNSNQSLAMDYRSRQLAILEKALEPIISRLKCALSFSTFCQHPQHLVSNHKVDNYFASMHSRVELLSLECAFDWLRIHYLDIFTAVAEIISQDQEEPLPLDWTVLVEDWDHTYWVIWIYIIWMLWARDGEAFRLRHNPLSTWLVEMNDAYDSEINHDNDTDGVFHADASEEATINETINKINHIVPFQTLRRTWSTILNSSKLRNLASFVAQEETFSVLYEMQGGHRPGAKVEQKVLLVSKRKGTVELGELDVPPGGNKWSEEFFGGSPGWAGKRTVTKS